VSRCRANRPFVLGRGRKLVEELLADRNSQQSTLGEIHPNALEYRIAHFPGASLMATVLSQPERLVILRGISWQTYNRIVAEHGENSGTRFTYDEGVLEIMVLSSRREEPNRTLALLVEVLAEEMN